MRCDVNRYALLDTTFPFQQYDRVENYTVSEHLHLRYGLNLTCCILCGVDAFRRH